MTGDENSTVTLTCTASSVYAPTVKILRNNKELNTKTMKDESYNATVVRANFTFSHVTVEDSGKYICIAKNRQKSVKADVTLIVNGE